MDSSMIKLLMEVKGYIVHRLQLSKCTNFATLRAGCMYDSDVLAAALDELLAEARLVCVGGVYSMRQ
jgi:hypothetical protein